MTLALDHVLIAVADRAQAEASAFGRWVASASPSRPMGWAVRTDDLDAVAARLRLDIVPGSRTAPDGPVLRWRMAGIEAAAAEPFLPFFIEWGEGTPLPGGCEGPGAGCVCVATAGGCVSGSAAPPLPVEVLPGVAAVLELVAAGLDMQPIGCI